MNKEDARVEIRNKVCPFCWLPYIHRNLHDHGALIDYSCGNCKAHFPYPFVIYDDKYAWYTIGEVKEYDSANNIHCTGFVPKWIRLYRRRRYYEVNGKNYVHAVDYTSFVLLNKAGCPTISTWIISRRLKGYLE